MPRSENRTRLLAGQTHRSRDVVVLVDRRRGPALRHQRGRTNRGDPSRRRGVQGRYGDADQGAADSVVNRDRPGALVRPDGRKPLLRRQVAVVCSDAVRRSLVGWALAHAVIRRLPDRAAWAKAHPTWRSASQGILRECFDDTDEIPRDALGIPGCAGVLRDGWTGPAQGQDHLGPYGAGGGAFPCSARRKRGRNRWGHGDRPGARRSMARRSLRDARRSRATWTASSSCCGMLRGK